MMDDKKLLLLRAAEKIRQLRRENEVLRAKVDTMDLMAAFFFADARGRGQGAEVDVAWELEQAAHKMGDKGNV